MTTLEQQPDKSEVVRFLLEKEGRVMLCLDATHTGVSVPRRFVQDRGLRLILSTRMPQPIEIGVTAIESELRFGGIPHYCIIPYDALWGAYNPDSGHGMFWPGDMPVEVRDGFETHGMDTRLPPGLRPSQPASRKPASSKGSKPRLQVIEGGANQPVNSASDGESSEQPPPRRPNLRLVE